jgi:hypothetical protein
VKSLVLRFEPNPIEFTLPEALGPYPYVLEFSNLRLAARAGHLSGLGVGESPSMQVKLTNREGRVARMIGQPLRVLAEVWEDGELYFAGLVQSAEYGRQIALNIEA